MLCVQSVYLEESVAIHHQSVKKLLFSDRILISVASHTLCSVVRDSKTCVQISCTGQYNCCDESMLGPTLTASLSLYSGITPIILFIYLFVTCYFSSARYITSSILMGLHAQMLFSRNPAYLFVCFLSPPVFTSLYGHAPPNLLAYPTPPHLLVSLQK